MSAIVFLPVNASSQKNSFNVKELTTLFNNMITKVTDSIISLNSNDEIEELTQTLIKNTIIDGINSIYIKKETSKKVKQDKPTRPLSSYILYCNEIRSRVKSENPTDDSKDITRKLAIEWKKLTDDEKLEYKNKSSSGKSSDEESIIPKSKKETVKKTSSKKVIHVPLEEKSSPDVDEEEEEEEEEEPLLIPTPKTKKI